MNRNPERTAEQTHGATHPESARGKPPDVSTRREHRHRGEQPRVTGNRRWRFTDAVTAARQLSVGNAGG